MEDVDRPRKEQMTIVNPNTYRDAIQSQTSRPTSGIAAKIPPAQLDRLSQELATVRILKGAGGAWVSRRLFLRERQFGGYDITQVATRIKTLRDEYGCVIDSKFLGGDDFVSYRWVSGPSNIEELVAAKIRLSQEKRSAKAKQGKFSDSPDWFERQTGRPRGSEDSPVTAGPLFAGVSRD